MTSIFFVQCIIKQLLDSVFVISKTFKVSVRGISRLQLKGSASADNPYLKLHYSGYHRNLINKLLFIISQ